MRRRLHRSGKFAIVATRELAATRNDRRLARQSSQQNSSLDGIKTAIMAEFLAILSLRNAAVPQHAQARRYPIVVGKHNSSIAETTKYLHSVETHAGDIAEGA
jgi:hypothetical protein